MKSGLITLVLFALAGCAHHGSDVARGSISRRGDAPAGYYAKSSPPAAPSASAESAGSDRYQRSPQREQEDRPGLGTVWGENRHSPVQHRSFVRATTAPFSALSVFYNDAAGIAAQTRHRGGVEINAYQAATSGGGITVALTGRSGRILPGQQAGGRTYVVGQQGERYTIVITNQTGGRFEVVASVDGLDVIDGELASVAKRGYLLQPHGRLEIDGYRRTDSTVAAFRFGRVRDSYAARTRGDRNVGVIGIALFAERGSVWTTDEIRRREQADPFPGYAQPPPTQLIY